MRHEPAGSQAPMPPDVCIPGPRTGQRLAWGVLALLVAAAAAGFFGNGPWNHASLARDGLQVDYEPVVRVRAASDVRLGIGAASPEGVRLVLGFDGRRLRIDDVFPEPVRQRLTADGAELEFETRGPSPGRVALRILPLQPGRYELTVAVDGKPPLRIRQRALP